MPKLGMEPIRKRQLIEATIASIHAHGLADTTMATIGRAAGLSPGIIHHYFGGKDALLGATMRALLVELRGYVVTGLRAADGPRARIEAIIDASFADRQFQPRVIVTWLAFWGQAPHDGALMRLQRIYARRLQSNLRARASAAGRRRARGGGYGGPCRIDRRVVAELRARPSRPRRGDAPGRVARDYLHRQLEA